MIYMRQVNINVTPEFDRALSSLMAARGLTSKSKAIRMAIAEAAERATGGKADFKSWIGAGLKAAPAKKRRFKTEDDLWS